MKITIIHNNRKLKKQTISTIDFETFLNRVTYDTKEQYVARYRESYSYLAKPKDYVYFDRLIRAKMSGLYTADAENKPKFRSFSGLVALEIENLLTTAEVGLIKEKSQLLPQTLASFEGCDGHSVVIICQAALPDGKLPTTEEQTEQFLGKAYRIAVQCYQPNLPLPITLYEPLPSHEILMPLDEKPFYNPRAVPFIVEMPHPNELRNMDRQSEQSPLDRLQPSLQSYDILHRVYETCFRKAMAIIRQRKWEKKPMAQVAVIAKECLNVGMPEEETVDRIWWHFYEEEEMDIRMTVRSVYADHDVSALDITVMPKKQIAAFRLREFLKRRYEIRYNEVEMRTEYRVRHSLDFRFREMGKRDRNTIIHEAALEGIEAFESELTGLINSNYTPVYNPIDDFISHLGKWDGHDRISELADMVPNTNPHWRRLFGRWFISMVGHWMGIDREHANNTAPILIGEQGFRKSTFCRILLPPELRRFFTDSLDFRTDNEAERFLGRFLLINIDEFDKLTEKQFAFIKHLFQKPNVAMRRMYSENIATQRRYASFIGTSNQHEILRDPTGNRRYLCVEVTGRIDVERPIDYQQLYAQAVQLINKGERYWLDDSDEALLQQTNAAFEAQSSLEQLLLTYFRKPDSSEKGEWLRPTDIMERLKESKIFSRSMNNVPLLGRLLKKMGLEWRHTNAGNSYLIMGIAH